MIPLAVARAVPLWVIALLALVTLQVASLLVQLLKFPVSNPSLNKLELAFVILPPIKNKTAIAVPANPTRYFFFMLLILSFLMS